MFCARRREPSGCSRRSSDRVRVRAGHPDHRSHRAGLRPEAGRPARAGRVAPDDAGQRRGGGRQGGRRVVPRGAPDPWGVSGQAAAAVRPRQRGGWRGARGHRGRRVKPGDRVAAFCMLGGFAEVAVAPEHLCFELPDELDFDQGASLVLNYHTAYFCLKLRGRLAEGETVLVHGAAGGVGSASLQVARGLGARTIAVVSSDEKEQVARQAGADEVLRSDGPWKDQAKDISDGGVDIVIDPVGGDRFTDSLRSLREGGRLVVVGFTAGSIPEVRVNRLLLNNVDVVGAGWGAFVMSKPELTAQVGAAINELIGQGFVRPVVGAKFPLERAAEALNADRPPRGDRQGGAGALGRAAVFRRTRQRDADRAVVADLRRRPAPLDPPSLRACHQIERSRVPAPGHRTRSEPASGADRGHGCAERRRLCRVSTGCRTARGPAAAGCRASAGRARACPADAAGGAESRTRWRSRCGAPRGSGTSRRWPAWPRSRHGTPGSPAAPLREASRTARRTGCSHATARCVREPDSSATSSS